MVNGNKYFKADTHEHENNMKINGEYKNKILSTEEKLFFGVNNGKVLNQF